MRTASTTMRPGAGWPVAAVLAAAVLVAACAGSTQPAGAPSTVRSTRPPVTEFPTGSTPPPRVSPAPAVTRAPTTAASTTTTAPLPLSAVGGTLTLTGRGGDLVAVTVAALVDPVAPTRFSTPAPGRRFVGVRLRVVNTGGTVWRDAPFNGARLVDTTGATHEPIVSAAGGPPLVLATVLPGDTRLGSLVFPVPDGAVVDRLTLALDSGFGPVRGEWALGAGAPADPAPAVTPAGVVAGESRTLAPLRGGPVEVTVRAVVDPATPTGFWTPAPGHRFVALPVDYRNAGTTDHQDVPGNGVRLVDARGQVWSPTFLAEVAEGAPFPPTVSLGPGETATGSLVFELPDDVGPVKAVVVLSSGLAADVVEWSTGA